eukprot:6182220-Pleurochrysis_carterae.AAC.2
MRFSAPAPYRTLDSDRAQVNASKLSHKLSPQGVASAPANAQTRYGSCASNHNRRRNTHSPIKRAPLHTLDAARVIAHHRRRSDATAHTEHRARGPSKCNAARAP